MNAERRDTDRNTEALALRIAEILTEQMRQHWCPFDPDQRKADHEWVLLRRQKEMKRIEFWQALNLHVAKWGAVSLLTVFLYALWLALKQEIAR